MGVGYVIGPRIAGAMFAGGVLSWLVLLPLLSILGALHHGAVPADPSELREQPGDRHAVRSRDGARTALERLHPLHRRRRRAGGRPHHAGPHAPDDHLVVPREHEGLRRRRRGAAQAPHRARHADCRSCSADRCCWRVFLAVAPRMPTQGNFLAAILVVVFGFFFVTVSSRITGLIGTSSNPISGMTIATLILTCRSSSRSAGPATTYAPIALCVGAVVCIAAANAGGDVAGSEDRLPGRRDADLPADRPAHRRRRLGARHRRARRCTCTSVMGIGSASLPAPQATLMATIIKGLLEPEPAVGARAGRRVHLGHARAVRHPLAVVRGRLVPADRHDGADLRRRPGAARSSSARPGSRRGIGGRRRHAVQLGPDRRRLARGDPLRRALRPPSSSAPPTTGIRPG